MHVSFCSCTLKINVTKKKYKLYFFSLTGVQKRVFSIIHEKNYVIFINQTGINGVKPNLAEPEHEGGRVEPVSLGLLEINEQLLNVFVFQHQKRVGK
jgi:hypothetical protein